MMTLLRTELRQLWPIAALWIFLELLYTGMLMFTTRVDETEYAELCDAMCQPGVSRYAIFIIGAIVVWIGWSLFPKDSDDGTLAHLSSLAVSRPQIYLSKIFAALLLIFLLYLFSTTTTYLMVALNPQSIHGKYYAAMESQHFLRNFAFSAIVLSHAVFLSSFRLIGLVVYAAYFAFIGWIESAMPAGDVGAWNLVNLMRVEFYGSDLVTDWKMFAIHGAIALIFLWFG